MTAGVLYVAATPIGNLEDWTHRAARVLQQADLVLAEDTRHTRKLLRHYGIQAAMESYHDFNETGRAALVLERLQAGARVALVSDQGTPGISDPGYRLVQLCRENAVSVIPIPGASAAVAALSVSGLPTDAFHFVGFLPSRKESRRRRLQEMDGVTATLVAYEAPHRIRSCLEDLRDILGERRMFLAREMTKLHEQYLFGTVSEVLARLEPRGEIVLVIAGASTPTVSGGATPNLAETPRRELLKLIARRLGVNRRALYDALYRKED